jgi:uncharacterized protein YjbI with pentapeptide repeats
MSPEVIAAIIAGSVGIVTLIATVIVQVVGFRSTKANTEQQITAAEKNTADTLEAQRVQLDRTLAEQRTRTLNERFATAAEQLGSDKPAVRLAGVYAMAGLADDWGKNQEDQQNRQTCVDVLCAYLRMPYEPDPGQDAPAPQRLVFQAIRQVRRTVIGVITAHLQWNAAVSWQGLNFDFTGAVFDGGGFSGARFSGGVSFDSARFSGEVDFSNAQFSDGWAVFDGAQFSPGGTVNFGGVRFGGTAAFHRAQFSGGTVLFTSAQFRDGSTALFDGARFSDGTVDFSRAWFTGGRVAFEGAWFSGGTVLFDAWFTGGTVVFNHAQFTGGRVDFSGARFSGGTVDFSFADNWSKPPIFSWEGNEQPRGVKLPRKEDQSEA